MQTQSCVFILSVIITGSLSASWDMTVSPIVWAPKGEDVVLPCSFTHPKQQNYGGYITVKWLARVADADPFFRCSLRNDSGERLSDCSASGLRYSLYANPQQGALSLLIRGLQLSDNGTYYCRVELERRKDNIQRATHLYVTAKAEILSLSVVEDGRTLRCEAEGHPLPNITWLSASRGPPERYDPAVRTGLYQLSSSVPFQEDDVFTCRAENELGGAERRHPARDTLGLSLSVCGALLLLLLLCGLAIHCLRKRARAEASPVYDNVEVGSLRPVRRPEAPAGDAAEAQLVYSVVSLQRLSGDSAVQTGVGADEEPVFYSLLNAPQ